MNGLANAGSASCDVLIAGAGIMGLGIALELAREGAKVTVVDPLPPGQKASAAAAGILVTRGAQHALSTFRRFYLHSIAAYPAWLAGLEAETGQSVPFHRAGDHLIFDRGQPSGEKAYQDKLAQLKREEALPWQELNGLPDYLQPFAAQNPALHAGLTTLHFPHEAYVQNRILLSVLVDACQRRGVRFSSPMVADRNIAPTLEWKQDEWSVAWGDLDCRAGQILITAGAWSQGWLLALGLESSLIPVKGQVAMIRKPWMPQSMVHFQEDLYLIPRQNQLIVGATTEPGAWEETFTPEGEKSLSQRLARFLPGLDFVPTESWAGLRPRTRDRLPLMGRIPGHARAWICSGHYKCGISMAPLASRCMSALVRGHRSPIEMDAFDPGRKGALIPSRPAALSSLP
jgi:glycine oxidase